MKTKINILYIFHVSEIGGGSFCLLNIIKKLDREYFNPLVLLKNDGPLVIELEKIGATVFIEKTLSAVLYNRSILKPSSLKLIYNIIISLSKVEYWIRETKADIVHINTMMMYPYLLPISKLKRKSVIHIRENWPKNEHQNQLKLAKYIISKYADKIVAINNTSADIIGAPSKTVVIHDWIDFENRDEDISFEKLFGAKYKSLKIFVFFGGMQRIKGALEIINTFSKELFSPDIRLLFVGCKSKNLIFNGLKGSIKKHLAAFNYYSYYDKIKYLALQDDRIVFIPSTYKIKRLIETSFCVLSFHTIPHANLTLAESIFLGTPAIAASTTEALEYCNNGESALLFERNNSADFKQKILYAINNEEIIKSQAQNGMKDIRMLFDPERNSLLLNNLYKNLSIK